MKRLLLALLLLILTTVGGADEMRQANLEHLRSLGFKPASSLPVGRRGSLRPQQEIERRLEALHALIMWVAGPADPEKDQAVRQQAINGDMSAWLTESEKDIFRQSKEEAYENHIDTIGWQMENAWALAWVLGYKTQPALNGQLQGELARDVILGFCARKEYKLRPLEEVRQMEDLFYCAHNAIRSAQLGHQTVPQGFDPVSEGGGIHERRHSLTWCLSPGVAWDQTDLST